MKGGRKNHVSKYYKTSRGSLKAPSRLSVIEKDEVNQTLELDDHAHRRHGTLLRTASLRLHTVEKGSHTGPSGLECPYPKCG